MSNLVTETTELMNQTIEANGALIDQLKIVMPGNPLIDILQEAIIRAGAQIKRLDSSPFAPLYFKITD